MEVLADGRKLCRRCATRARRALDREFGREPPKEREVRYLAVVHANEEFRRERRFKALAQAERWVLDESMGRPRVEAAITALDGGRIVWAGRIESLDLDAATRGGLTEARNAGTAGGDTTPVPAA